MTTEQQAEQALLRLKALQLVTERTGTITNKAQRELLRSLPPDVLTLVAEELYRSKNPILNPTQETDRDHTRR